MIRAPPRGGPRYSSGTLCALTGRAPRPDTSTAGYPGSPWADPVWHGDTPPARMPLGTSRAGAVLFSPRGAPLRRGRVQDAFPLLFFSGNIDGIAKHLGPLTMTYGLMIVLILVALFVLYKLNNKYKWYMLWGATPDCTKYADAPMTGGTCAGATDQITRMTSGQTKARLLNVVAACAPLAATVEKSALASRAPPGTEMYLNALTTNGNDAEACVNAMTWIPPEAVAALASKALGSSACIGGGGAVYLHNPVWRTNVQRMASAAVPLIGLALDASANLPACAAPVAYKGAPVAYDDTPVAYKGAPVDQGDSGNSNLSVPTF